MAFVTVFKRYELKYMLTLEKKKSCEYEAIPKPMLTVWAVRSALHTT